MNLTVSVNQEELLEVLLNVAPSRPVFIWGAPGIGKTALVEKFAAEEKAFTGERYEPFSYIRELEQRKAIKERQ